MSRYFDVLSQVRYPGLGFEIINERDHAFLRVVCEEAIDSRTGVATSWVGRKWRLSEHMTDGEVVQTALMAVLAALEHEARERFTFQGAAIFDPHYDIYKLVELRRQADALMERP